MIRNLHYVFTLILFALILAACDPNVHGSMLTYSPHLEDARKNARLGLTYLHSGNTMLAEEKFTLAEEEAPNDPVVLDVLAFYYEKIGATDLANQTYFHALSLDPRSALRNNYGAFLCRNDYDEASLPYFLYATRKPADGQAHQAYRNAQFCAEKLGDPDEYAYYTKLLGKPF